MEGADQLEFVRRPSVAGTFYTGDPELLRAEVTGMLADNAGEPVDGHVRALVSPHAGYMYSGAVAAAGYQQLTHYPFRTVVVVAPSHRYFKGVALFPGDGYETPLGVVPVATDIIDQLSAPEDGFNISSFGHGEEHSLEVQLPFLQVVLDSFQLVPVAIGDQQPGICTRLGERLAPLLEDDACVLVASSDLSHMHSYDAAVELDQRIVARLDQYDVEGFTSDWLTQTSEACGGGPIISIMTAAKKAGADRSKVLTYQNSGDVTGDRNAVVGYLSAVFYRERKLP